MRRRREAARLTLGSTPRTQPWGELAGDRGHRMFEIPLEVRVGGSPGCRREAQLVSSFESCCHVVSI